MPQANTKQQTSVRMFLPAKPSQWVLWCVYNVLRFSLPLENRLHIDPQDLERLRKVTAGCGVILTPNHADEADPQVCLELSRRSRRRFIFMGNREAFDEYRGAAGWGLQRIGMFSVERGGHDVAAKDFAVEVTRLGKDVLVIFPEGEIFYLNDSVQPFHSGAIDIGIKAVIEERKTRPEYEAYIVPMAIKYNYVRPISQLLEKRVSEMEKRLSRDMSGHALRKRLLVLVSELLQRQELAYKVKSDSEKFERLNDHVKFVRHSILAQIDEKYSGIANAQGRTIDRAWQISDHLRDLINESTATHRAIYEQDLNSLQEVAHMVSWKPDYINENPSEDRLAELLIKLEREVFKVKRPRPLGQRNVYLRIGEPVALSQYLADYKENPHAVRHHVAEHLRERIQTLLDNVLASTVSKPQ
jgi:1-acyl-sn-glycerol-3-phosphate acyltransferase